MPIDNFEAPPNWSVIKNLSEDSNGNLLYKGLTIGSGGSSTQARILYRDPNWGFQAGYGTSQFYWRSRVDGGPGETATGRLDFGYLNLKSNLTLLMAGGGATNGNLKSMQLITPETNTVLDTFTLAVLLGGINTDGLKIVTISTATWNGNVCFLRFQDTDPNSSWAWVGVDLANIYCY